MKLPNYEQAVIAPAKIIHYLLNENHPKGRSLRFSSATVFLC